MTMLQARPTTYKGIQMRSRTEALYAADLDRDGVVWEYEPRCFADENGQYLPDFRVEMESGTPLYIEIKGKVERFLPILEQMSVIWSSEPRARLLLLECSSDKRWAGKLDMQGHQRWTLHEYGHKMTFCLTPSHRVEGGLCPAYEH